MRKFVAIALVLMIMFAFGCAKKQAKEPVVRTDILKLATAGSVNKELIDANVDVTKARTVLREKYGVDNFKAYKIIKKAYPNCKIEKVASFTYKKALKDAEDKIIVLRFEASVVPVTLKVKPIVDFVFDQDRNLVAITVKK